MAIKIWLVGLLGVATLAGAANVIIGDQEFAYNIPFCGS